MKGLPFVNYATNLLPVVGKTKRACAPTTSVPSERLFSGAGQIYDDRRSRLAPEKAEMLLYIKNNFALVGDKYTY